ncbi:MAG: hypothetical protein INH41_07925 [Myxococcaceae bacterium]|jgi:hypothetical protein|nr:hypothetical protein [Myxococcaceae bacterium]MCA3012312.1 hypothetical protein [Myxococcaceae bacterium]
MDEAARAAFLFADPEPLEDGSRWTACFVEWDPYRHMTLTMDVSLAHADGPGEAFEHVLGVPAGIGAADRQQVREALAFECRRRAGLFARARAAREAAEGAPARPPAPAPGPRRWSFELLARGLPTTDGAVANPGRTYRFPCAAAEGHGWSLGVPSVREDRTFWAPEDWDQLRWVEQQSDLTGELSAENTATLTDAAAFEFAERLGGCLVGPSLEERFVLAGGDVIAPPAAVAGAVMDDAHRHLADGRAAKAFDLATRMLASREQRAAARRLRAEVLEAHGCVEDARLEWGRARLLGGATVAPAFGAAPAHDEPARERTRAVALELQGLPREDGGVDEHLVRFLFRVEVTKGVAGATVAPLADPPGDPGAGAPPPRAQAAWLSRVTGRGPDDAGRWPLDDERAVVDLVLRHAGRCLRGRSGGELLRALDPSRTPA